MKPKVSVTRFTSGRKSSTLTRSLFRRARRAERLHRQHDDLLVQHLIVLQIVHQRGGRDVGIAGEEDRRAAHAVRRMVRKRFEQFRHRLVAAHDVGENAGAAHPGPEHDDQARRQRQRHEAALPNALQVRGQEDQLDQRERRDDQRATAKPAASTISR